MRFMRNVSDGYGKHIIVVHNEDTAPPHKGDKTCDTYEMRRLKRSPKLFPHKNLKRTSSKEGHKNAYCFGYTWS